MEVKIVDTLLKNVVKQKSSIRLYHRNNIIYIIDNKSVRTSEKVVLKLYDEDYAHINNDEIIVLH